MSIISLEAKELCSHTTVSDNPMPSDAMSQISLHSAKSPTVLSGKSFRSSRDQYPSPQRSKNIKVC